MPNPSDPNVSNHPCLDLGRVGRKKFATFFSFGLCYLEWAVNRGLYRAAGGLAARGCCCDMLAS